MSASITFLTPIGRVRDIAENISRNWGTVTGLGVEGSQDAIEISRFLELNAGELVEIRFDEILDDNPVSDLSQILDCHQAPYFGYWPAYETKARRDRFDGGYIVRHGTEICGERKSYAWQNGDPGPFEADMLLAGFTGAQVERIIGQFFVEPASMMTPAFGR